MEVKTILDALVVKQNEKKEKNRKRKNDDDTVENSRPESKYWYKQLINAVTNKDEEETIKLLGYGICQDDEQSENFLRHLLTPKRRKRAPPLGFCYNVVQSQINILQKWAVRPGANTDADSIRSELLIAWISRMQTPNSLSRHIKLLFGSEIAILPKQLANFLTPDQITRAGKHLKLAMTSTDVCTWCIKSKKLDILREKCAAAAQVWIDLGITSTLDFTLYDIRFLVRYNIIDDYWSRKLACLLCEFPELEFIGIECIKCEDLHFFMIWNNLNIESNSPTPEQFDSMQNYNNTKLQVFERLKDMKIMDNLLHHAGFPNDFKFPPDVGCLIASYLVN